MSLLKRFATLAMILSFSCGALTLGGCHAEGEVDTDGDAHGIEHHDEADMEIEGDVEVDAD